jgi:hypothetical protein
MSETVGHASVGQSQAAKDLEQGWAEFEPHTPPPLLYRFYDAGALGALTKGTLKVEPPTEFNDPFEMRPGTSVVSRK